MEWYSCILNMDAEQVLLPQRIALKPISNNKILPLQSQKSYERRIIRIGVPTYVDVDCL